MVVESIECVHYEKYRDLAGSTRHEILIDRNREMKI